MSLQREGALAAVPALEAHGLRVRYGTREVVRGVNLSVPGADANGEPVVVGLVGPNGCGKSTLLNALIGALPVAGGKVQLGGHALARYRRRDIARRVALVAQAESAELSLSVSELVLLGRLPHAGWGGPGGMDDQRIAAESLARVGATNLAHRSVRELSGGELQRVLIARALAQCADVLLLDEPTNHLDIRYQHEVLGLLRSLSLSSLVVLHDLNLAAAYCDVVHVMDRGRIVAAGAPAEVLAPRILEPIYGVGIERVDLHGRVHLLFGQHGGHQPDTRTHAAEGAPFNRTPPPSPRISEL